MEKKFFTGMAVLLLGASLFFAGCGDSDDGTDTGTTPDTESNWYGGLGDGLAEVEGTVTVTGNATLSTALVVPAGKTLAVVQGATLTVTGTLTGTDATSKLELGTGVTVTVAGTDLAAGTYVWHNAGWFDEDDYVAAVEAADALVASGGVLAGKATASGTTVRLTATDATGTIAAGDTLAVPVDVTLVIPNGKILSVAGTLTVAGTVDVENGGTFTLESGNANSDLTGTIHVKNGGTSKDLKSGGASLWGDSGSGTYVFDAGAKGYVGGTADTDLLIGASADTGAVIQLESGTFSNTKTTYELDGVATARGAEGTAPPENKYLFIAGDMTFTLRAGGELKVSGVSNEDRTVLGIMVTEDNAPGVTGEGTGANAAKIVLNTWGFIDFFNTSGEYSSNAASIDHNFYNSGNQKETSSGLTNKTYTWNATAGGDNTPGWKAGS
jgi:hypothetical protein